MKLQFLASILLITIISHSAFGWSAPGHQAIGRAALNMIGISTKDTVDGILGDETVEDAATWLDHVREMSKGRFHFDDQDEQDAAVQFNHNFKGNGDWHFVNYPVGLTDYHLDGKFSSSNDVVHGIERAIEVLEGAPSEMSKLQALRVLIHLVGDIHQPLHCVTGYFDLSDMDNPKLLEAAKVKDPKKTVEDRGANQLFYTPKQELHAFWDRQLPEAISKDPAELVNAISVSNLKQQPRTDGDYHKWAEMWASETMQAGAAAYNGLEFTSAEFLEDPQHPDHQTLFIHTKLPGGTAGYKAAQKDRAEEQLRKAAVHLAQLLGSIKFQ